MTAMIATLSLSLSLSLVSIYILELWECLANGIGKWFPTHQNASLNSNQSFSAFLLILTFQSYPNPNPTPHFPLSKHTL